MENNEIKICDGKHLRICGVKKVITCSPKEISLMLENKSVVILGEGISTSKLDIESSVVEAEGEFGIIKFIPQKNSGGLFKRIFK